MDTNAVGAGCRFPESAVRKAGARLKNVFWQEHQPRKNFHHTLATEFHSGSQCEALFKGFEGREMGVDSIITEGGGVPTLGRLTKDLGR